MHAHRDAHALTHACINALMHARTHSWSNVFHRLGFLLTTSLGIEKVVKQKRVPAGIPLLELVCLLLSRVHNIYIEESILLSYTPVEGRIVKF